ncbi:MAG TPA: DUF5522 domain-containing protein [Fimbriimonas sp.]|nr:DUF5522 domain-containing protein [Fimbriimonas sp.]
MDTLCWCRTLKPRAGQGDGQSCLCRECLEKPSGEEESIFDEDGALTRTFLLERGFCCGNKCRNCPYGWMAVPQNPTDC